MSTAITAWAAVAPLARDLVDAWGCWAPTLTADGARVASSATATACPQLWVQDAAAAASAAVHRR